MNFTGGAPPPSSWEATDLSPMQVGPPWGPDMTLHILSRAETSLDICRSARDIYAYLSDFTRHWEWAHTILSVEVVTPGPTRVGSRFRFQEKQDWRWDKRPFTTIADREGRMDFVAEAEVTALEPDARIAWQSAMADGPFRGAWEFVLEQVDDSITTVRLRGRVTAPPDAMHHLLEDLQRSGYPVDLFARQADRAMHNIRTILEGRAQPPPGGR